ncbi:MAG: glycosyltransferase family 9 protein, partial [Chitinivibrionales bacterium]|nr:glycosyltransferase family 9 protein [Chitinivibrionales bacterium]
AGALGDFITIVPALRLCRQAFPGYEIILLGKPELAILARENGLVDEVWDLGRNDFAALFDGAALEVHAKFLDGIHRALLFCADSSPLMPTVMRFVAHVLRQDPFPPGKTHIVDYHLSLLKKILPPFRAEYPDLYRALKGNDRPLKRPPTLALHPGSGSVRKNWPFDFFLQLAGRLRANDRAILWVLGPADSGLHVPAQDETARCLVLPLLARRLAQCQLFVGNDSGIAHLAAAVGIPVAALFGPSDPDVWRPFGRNVTVIDANPSCRPCHPTQNQKKPCTHNCLETITVETVYKHCMSYL